MPQRILDIIFSLLCLILLLPMFITIICILKFTGEGEVFYMQERVGKHLAVIKIFKFATMLKNSPRLGSKTITLKDDPRILPVGRFLRVTKINELPQLINILKGDMSFVGPRPLTLENWNYYTQEQKKIISRNSPGLTGVGSIYFRNEEKYLDVDNDPVYVYRNTIAPIKAQCEVWFEENKSLKLYFIILFLTGFSVVFKDSTWPQWFIANLAGIKMSDKGSL